MPSKSPAWLSLIRVFLSERTMPVRSLATTHLLDGSRSPRWTGAHPGRRFVGPPSVGRETRIGGHIFPGNRDHRLSRSGAYWARLLAAPFFRSSTELSVGLKFPVP
jgi:hypothetical protein